MTAQEREPQRNPAAQKRLMRKKVKLPSEKVEKTPMPTLHNLCHAGKDFKGDRDGGGFSVFLAPVSLSLWMFCPKEWPKEDLLGLHKHLSFNEVRWGAKNSLGSWTDPRCCLPSLFPQDVVEVWYIPHTLGQPAFLPLSPALLPPLPPSLLALRRISEGLFVPELW